MRQRFEKMLYLSGSILFQILLIGLVINLAGCVAGIKPVAVKSGSMEPSTTLYTTTDVNVRSQPGTSSGLVDSLGSGQSLQVIGETDNWYYIESFDAPKKDSLRKEMQMKHKT